MNPRQQRLETASQRWSSAETLLDPDSHYLLEVSTRAVLTMDGTTVQQLDHTHTLQFQTGGPPGIVPAWVAPPADPATAGLPWGGALKDLARYVRWTIPDPGTAPVFWAYDLGCEFDTSAVQQLYGADLVITVYDDNGQPLRDPSGPRSCRPTPGRRGLPPRCRRATRPGWTGWAAALRPSTWPGCAVTTWFGRRCRPGSCCRLAAP